MASLISIFTELIFWFVIFIAALIPFGLVYYFMRRRRNKTPPTVATDFAQMRMPLINERSGTIIKISGEQYEAVGTLRGYGFTPGGNGIVKYFTDATVFTKEGEENRRFDHLLSLEGPDPDKLSTFITSQNITSEDELMQKLGLTSPKFEDLQMVGNWAEQPPIWRKLAELRQK